MTVSSLRSRDATKLGGRPAGTRVLTSRVKGALKGRGALVAGSTIVLGWVVATIFAPLIVSHSPTVPSGAPSMPPSAQHYFGTDNLGFDVFSRVLYAPRSDLLVACGGTLIAMAIGTVLGVAIGMARGVLSDAPMRLVDALQAFPLLILALTLVSALGQDDVSIIAAIAFINVPIFLRIVRAQVLSLRERRFVEAAIADGSPRWRVLLRHILPNTMGPVIAQTTVSMATAVIVVAALSYLTLGLKPPTPEWGDMIQAGTTALISGQWWMSVFPGVALGSLVCGFMLLGEGLQELFQTGGPA